MPSNRLLVIFPERPKILHAILRGHMLAEATAKLVVGLGSFLRLPCLIDDDYEWDDPLFRRFKSRVEVFYRSNPPPSPNTRR